jgi:flagellar secretion chaperone FliS
MSNRVSIYLEQEILSANPLQLVHILYQASITELREARRNMASRDIAAKCRNLTKASELVGELLSALDLDLGGEIAVRLKALYEYMLSRLLVANLRNLDEPIVETIALLSTLDEGWKELASRRPDAQLPQERSSFSSNFVSGDFDTPAQVWSF